MNAKYLLFIAVLVFGGLLLAYTASRFFSTQKKITEKQTSLDKTADVASSVKRKIDLWVYYFKGGNDKSPVMKIIFTLGIFLVCYVLNRLYIKIEPKTFCIIFIVAFIILIWKFGQSRNRKMFDNTFPEVIQILNSASSAGAGLLQSLDRCGKDLTGELGEEFKNIYKRLSIGEDPMSVFEDSYTRYPYKEFYFFITIIRTNLAKGGQMKEVISRLGRVIADSKKMEQKKKAMTSEARMSAVIVAIFPIFFFFFMQFAMPENFDFLINDPSGRYILYYVFGSEILGMSIIWWLMRKST